MKKLMFLFLMVFVFSCEDEWNFCYECTITKRYGGDILYVQKDSTVVLCDITTGRTDYEIDLYESQNTFSDGTYRQTCVCKKQE